MNKLIYVWFQRFRRLKDIGLNLNSGYRVTMREDGVLEISQGAPGLNSFFDSEDQDGSTIDFTGIVGENGVGKSSILDYILRPKRYGDSYCIYVFAEETESHTHFHVYYKYDEDSSDRSNDSAIKVECKIENADYEIELSDIDGNISGEDILSRQGISRFMLSNTMNEREYMDYAASLSAGDYSVTSHMKNCGFNMNVYYAEDFQRQMNYIIKYKQEEQSREEQIDFEDVFHILVPDKCHLTFISQKQNVANCNTREWNGHEAVKEFHNDLFRKYELLDSLRNYIVSVLVEFEHRYIFTLNLMKSEDASKKFEDRKKQIREIIENNVTAPQYELAKQLNRRKMSDMFRHLLEDFREFFKDDPHEIQYLDDVRRMYQKIGHLQVSNKEAEIPISEVTGENGLLQLHNRVFSKRDYLRFGWNLSSGEVAILSLLGNINAISENEKASKGYIDGENVLLLIDEMDLYLHPLLQQNMISILKESITQMFPNCRVHVIFSTHSPIILSDLPSNKVIFLKQDAKKNTIVVNEKDKISTFGANITSLYYNSFCMERGSIGSYARTKIQEIIRKLRADKPITELDAQVLQAEIACIGDPLIRRKLEQMLESKIKKTDHIDKKKYYQERIDYYNRLMNE